MWPIRALFTACFVIVIAPSFFSSGVFAQSTAKQGTVIQSGSDVSFDIKVTEIKSAAK